MPPQLTAEKKYFFLSEKFQIFFGTYSLSKVLKNKFLWQSDHGLCHQTTVYRARKFVKNESQVTTVARVTKNVFPLKLACLLVKPELVRTDRAAFNRNPCGDDLGEK